MDLQHVIRTFKRRWRPIAVLAVVGSALGLASGAVQEDAGPDAVPEVRYDACHTLLVDDAIPNDVPQWNVDNLSQLAERVKQGQIPRTVAADTGHDLPTATSHVRVGVRTDIRSLVICSVGETPAQAEALANGFAEELVVVLGNDAQEYYDRSLASAESRIIDAQTCVDEAARGEITAAADSVSDLDSAGQQVTLCELQLIDARTDEITLRAGGVPIVPFETLEPAAAQEISEADYNARVREGAAGTNVTTGNAETIGTATPARSSSAPSGPGLADSPAARAAAGLALGLALGIGVVQFTERLDSRLRRKEDVEGTLDLPVLAEIPPLARRERNRTNIVSIDDPRSRSAESFRALRSAIEYAHAVDMEAGRGRDDAIVVLVTSGAPSEGKTTTIANLAAVMAEGDKKVLAVNCDFRRPRLHRYLGGPTTAQRLNVTDIPGVQMVTQVTPNDAEATPSDVVNAQRRLIERARSRFDIILLDTAPILTTNDAADLLGVCDHVVLVVSAGNTKAEAAARATELLERRGRPPLGVALVGTREVPNSAEYYYSDDDPYLVASSKSRRRRRRSEDAQPEEARAEVYVGG